MDAINLIFQQFLKSRAVTTDSRKIESGTIFFALKGANFDGNSFAIKALELGASMAVVDNPSVKGVGVVYVEDCLMALQELARMYRKLLSIPVLGLTGTNGKTTTKELVTAVLSQKYKVSSTKGNLNNHIGVPLTILSIPADCEIAVVEMGANHPFDIDELTSIAMPNYGLITNVGKAHLEGFGSFDGVKKTKGELYDYLKAHGGVVFLNTDNVYLVEMAEQREIATFVEYGKTAMKVSVLPTNLNSPFLSIRLGDDSSLSLIESQIVGDYNVDNVLAAVVVGRYFNVEMPDVVKAIEEYAPDNNRSQLLRTSCNLVIVDCYNANPTSMEAALSNFSKFEVEKKVLILGDMLELGDVSFDEHQKVVRRVEEIKAAQIFLVGKEFGLCTAGDNVLAFNLVDELIEFLKDNPISGSLVLVKGSRGIKLETSLSLL